MLQTPFFFYAQKEVFLVEKLNKKVCKECGNEFTKEYNAQKYCSDKCKKFVDNQRKKGFQLTCLNCNKTFIGNKTNKFCSKECKSKHMKENFTINTFECKSCRKSFDSKNTFAQFCGTTCRSKHYREHNKIKCVCIVCEDEFETPYKGQKCCSVECANKSRTVQPLVTCEHCGREYRRQKNYGGSFCSRKCSFEHMKTKENIVCECCGEIFEKYPSRKSNLCSSCFQDELNKRREEKQREAENAKEKQCVTCQKIFNPDNMQQKYCSDECSPYIKTGKELEEYIESLNKECGTCGVTFTAAKPDIKYCSSKCRRKAKNRKAELSKGKRGELIKSNGRIDYDISLDKLIVRDDNTCHICGSKCDINDFNKNDEGYFIVGNMYPSIDHVTAIANGGTHTWDNVRIAHMICNSIKSDKLIV